MITYKTFPTLDNANEEGLLAMGGDLSVSTLVSAYAQGIFPWFNEGQPILWWSPDPRLVLYPDQIKASRSLKKSIKNKYRITCNHAFQAVIDGCALRGMNENTLDKEKPTWITRNMNTAYNQLHKYGYAHSVEAWQGKELVGGLYGVCLGKVFFGESMFSRSQDASKVALIYLCQHLLNQSFKVIDCQQASDHLFSLGAVEIPRADFLGYLEGIDVNSPTQILQGDFPESATELTHCFQSKIL